MTGEAFGNQGGHAEPGPSPPEVSPEVPPEVKHQVRLGGWGVVALMLMMSVMSATANGAQQGDGTAKSYAPYPQPDHGYVTDLAKVLGAQREEAIEQKLGAVEKETGVEIVVVTIGSMSDYPGVPQDIEALSRGLFDVYGVGNMPANNGVLLVVAVKDRAARIELGAGYVHARDGDTNRIMQGRIIPRFRQNDYAGGIEAGVDAIVETFAKKKGEAGKVSGAASENGVVERRGESQGIVTVSPEVVRRGACGGLVAGGVGRVGDCGGGAGGCEFVTSRQTRLGLGGGGVGDCGGVGGGDDDLSTDEKQRESRRIVLGVERVWQ